MSPTEAKAWKDAHRSRTIEDATDLMLDIEKGWEDYAWGYMARCIHWIVDEGGKGVGPRPPVNLNRFLAKAIMEAVREAELTGRQPRVAA